MCIRDRGIYRQRESQRRRRRAGWGANLGRPQSAHRCTMCALARPRSTLVAVAHTAGSKVVGCSGCDSSRMSWGSSRAHSQAKAQSNMIARKALGLRAHGGFAHAGGAFLQERVVRTCSSGGSWSAARGKK
eukprot:7110804-Prymnesium_polylepis.1